MIPLIFITVCAAVALAAILITKNPDNPVTELTEQLIEVEAEEMIGHTEEAKD